MEEVWAVADSIVSPLGLTSRENFDAVAKGKTGPSHMSRSNTFAATFSDLQMPDGLTRFETICDLALKELFSYVDPDRSRTLFVLSTTKGNIDFLESNHTDHPRLHLHSTASFLAERYGLNKHLVISNACISGVLAMIVAKRYIQSGKYDHAVVVGADVLSNFIISGFQSLLALSPEPCRPFDLKRTGINLGEGAGALLLTSMPEKFAGLRPIKLRSGGVSNDANHISGPSRTGEELALAITMALESGDLSASEIDFVSAHGTATAYNDEMEAKAFSIAGFEDTPLHSLKGYYGHTLGAAGVIESIMCMHALRNNLAIRNAGYESIGVSKPLNICTTTESMPLNRILKTASGFGGCNAALILEK